VPTTTVHLPTELLAALDALAARTNVSRDRLVIEACEHLIHCNRGTWPPGFLESTHLSTKDRRALAAAGQALERSMRRARRKRPLSRPR
jgi:Ribbon-helix-helix protein, copG family